MTHSQGVAGQVSRLSFLTFNKCLPNGNFGPLTSFGVGSAGGVGVVLQVLVGILGFGTIHISLGAMGYLHSSGAV